MPRNRRTYEEENIEKFPKLESGSKEITANKTINQNPTGQIAKLAVVCVCTSNRAWTFTNWRNYCTICRSPSIITSKTEWDFFSLGLYGTGLHDNNLVILPAQREEMRGSNHLEKYWESKYSPKVASFRRDIMLHTCTSDPREFRADRMPQGSKLE